MREQFTRHIGIDGALLQHGPITMYHNQVFLDRDLKELQLIGYQVIDFDTANWTKEIAHENLKKKLNFSEHYGESLDAFNDCLGEIFSTDSKGKVIVFRHFDKPCKLDKEFCEGLLDVIAIQSRSWLISGSRLIGILQSDDPLLSFGKVGGTLPIWNQEETFAKFRINGKDDSDS